MGNENRGKKEKKIIRVLLVDDHASVRNGIRKLLQSAPDIMVEGEASDGAQALALVDQVAPDVILLDVEMPKMNGLTFTDKLKEKCGPKPDSAPRILAFSAYEDRQYILGMLDRGAAGYITKSEVPEILIKAVRGVARGEDGWISDRLATKIASWVDKTDGPHRMTLNYIELRILRLLSKKKTNQDIADQLHVSEEIIDEYIGKLAEKFRVKTRTELTLRARQEGLT